MIDAGQVAAVVPTRGDVPLEPVLAGLPFGEAGVWDNSTGDDLSVYGRYAAIERVAAPVVFTQDDDVILPAATVAALLAAYQPGKVVCNIPARFRRRYADSGLVGFGAVFDRDLPRQAFNAFFCAQGAVEYVDDVANHVFWTGEGIHEVVEGTFRRTCDLVFTMLTPIIKVDLPYTELPYGRDESRMWRQPGHFDERDRMRKLCRALRDGVAA